MIEQHEHGMDLSDNNAARSATTKTIKSIGGNGLRFHTYYRIKSGRHEETGVVVDGKPVPAEAYDIEIYGESDPVGSPVIGHDGNRYQAVHSHSTDVNSWMGSVPVKIIQVKL